MNAPNGRGSEDPGSMFTARAMLAGPAMAQFPAERVKEIVAALEVPLDPSQIEWRVMSTTKGQQPRRGQVVPYADQRAYTDRLNTLFTPAGWTRRYHSHQREFRAKQRSEDRREGARHL
jgi:Rad52/22 family double-strand break repair protein